MSVLAGPRLWRNLSSLGPCVLLDERLEHPALSTSSATTLLRGRLTNTPSDVYSLRNRIQSLTQPRLLGAVERGVLRPMGRTAASDVAMRPSTPSEIAAAVGRFATEPPAYSRADLQLLVREAARVGIAVFRLPRLGLRRHLDLTDPGLGYDAIAEAFAEDRHDSPHPVLCRHAREIVLQASGDPDKAAIHFRNKMARFAWNRAKQILKEINPGGAAIRRNILEWTDPSDHRRNRIYFLTPRDGSREPIPSAAHVRELCRLCGAGEWRIPLLHAGTHAILAANPEYASWVDFSQLELDYLEAMTVATIWPCRDAAMEDDPESRIDAELLLQFWRDKGQAIVWERFRTSTHVPPDTAKRLYRAYLDYFDDLVQTGGGTGRWEFVERYFPGIGRDEFRRLYRRALDGLHRIVMRLLAEWMDRGEEEVTGS